MKRQTLSFEWNTTTLKLCSCDYNLTITIAYCLDWCKCLLGRCKLVILEDGLIVVLRSSRIMVFMGHIYFQIVLPCVLSQADEFIWPLAGSCCRQGLEDPWMVRMQVQGARWLSHSPDTQIADTTQCEVQIRDKDIQWAVCSVTANNSLLLHIFCTGAYFRKWDTNCGPISFIGL